MVGALKGHTGPVLDMNFASNNKFLASCGEDSSMLPKDLDAGRCFSTDPAALVLSDDLDTTLSRDIDGMAPKERERAILSRRQRKNRTRAMREQRRDREDDQEDYNNESSSTRRRHHHHQRLYLDGSPSGSGDSSASNSPKMLRKQAQIDHHHGTTRKYVFMNKPVFMPSMSSLPTDLSWSENPWHCEPVYRNIQSKHLDDGAVMHFLKKYLLSIVDLTELGYPVECDEYPGCAMVLYRPPENHYSEHDQQQQKDQQQQYHLDVNAQEFIPSTHLNSYNNELEIDSGIGSASSVENSDMEPESLSDSDKNSDIVDSSSSSSMSSLTSFNYDTDKVMWGSRYDACVPMEVTQSPVLRSCARCSQGFYMDPVTNDYIDDEPCVHHWGKLRKIAGKRWTCCNQSEDAPGCSIASVHVWRGIISGVNGPLIDYVCTQPSPVIHPDNNYGAYAVDCEMCYTRRGLEVIKVTVVGIDGEIVYDTLVKPDVDVLDVNTRFSGVTADDLLKTTKTLRDVQKDLLSFIYAETILIGHGLENDLRVLKMMHTTVIDTCAVYPHYLGFPYRNSLKALAKQVLKREIQVSTHDSAEDAKSAVDLLLRKIEMDLEPHSVRLP
ncbi:uncharacterized protein LOC135161630 isoform X2 [Diachasmimorpha longicaudata]